MSTQYTVFWFFPCCLHAVLCPQDSQAERILSVFYSSSGLRVPILNLCWNENLLHIQRDKRTRRDRPELMHCPVMKDQWDYVLNDLQEFGGKEFLLIDRYSTEICSCFRLLLSWCFSTFHQTNAENAQNGPEDDFLMSRFQSLHHLFEVDYHDEEYWWVSSTLDIIDGRIILWFNVGPSSFPNKCRFCGWVGRNTSLWFCFSFWSARRSK